MSPEAFTPGTTFLQLGVDQRLALSSIEGQVTALFILFHKLLVSHSLLKTFVQGVSQVVPQGQSALTLGFESSSFLASETSF